MSGTWSTAFLKSAIRGSKGQPGGPQQELEALELEEGLDDLEGSSKAVLPQPLFGIAVIKCS